MRFQNWTWRVKMPTKADGIWCICFGRFLSVWITRKLKQACCQFQCQSLVHPSCQKLSTKYITWQEKKAVPKIYSFIAFIYVLDWRSHDNFIEKWFLRSLNKNHLSQYYYTVFAPRFMSPMPMFVVLSLLPKTTSYIHYCRTLRTFHFQQTTHCYVNLYR